MSSASKGLRRAGIGGLSALLAAATMTGLASTAQANWAATGGQIGLVDTGIGVNATQGAKLIKPGANDQALGDVRIAIPNSFKSGDVIDLSLFDRTATDFRYGAGNQDAAHQIGFAAPGTAVADAAGPFASTVGISATNSNNTQTTNTEGKPLAWAAPNPLLNPDVPANHKPAPAPLITTSLVQSSTAAGQAGVKDIVRLTINNTSAATTDPDGKWSITVSGLKVNLAADVSPGELRLVPFAYNSNNATPNFGNASNLFGNMIDDPGTAPYDPTIATYTVPAYVQPVTFSAASPTDIVADGTYQKVGDLTIAETNAYSLQAGTYTVTVNGATIRNNQGDDDRKLAATLTSPATGETISAVNPTDGGNTVTFTLTQADADAANSGKMSVKLSGLLLSDTSDGDITYSISGGSIGGAGSNGDHAFLVTAGTSLEIPQGRPVDVVPPTAPKLGVAADSQFTATVNQTDITATEALAAITSDVFHSTPTSDRIGGSDRYSTAAKMALDYCDPDLNNQAEDEEAGCPVVLASGQNFPDALSSNYLGYEADGAVLLTKKSSVPAATMNALRTLGTSTVYIVGGTGAVSSAVEAKLKSTPQYYQGGHQTNGQGHLQVIRLGGSDRYATNQIVNEYAAAISRHSNPVGRTQPKAGESSKLTGILATGQDFADAMTVGPATTEDLPLILTKSGSLSPTAAKQMTNLDIEHAVIAGGNGAVSSAVQAAVEAKGVTTNRIGGANRAETATLFATWEIAPSNATASVNGGVGGLGFDPNPNDNNDQRAYLANQSVYADALAAGLLAGYEGQGAPILLTSQASLTPVTQQWLKSHADGYNKVTALGLGGAVSTAALNAATNAVSGL